jgi:hypothetical protein
VTFSALFNGLPLAADTQVGSAPWIVVAWVFVAIGVLSALVIAVDVLRGYRQHMMIMNWVYPITGLYWGPVAVYFYFRRGRQMSHRWAREHDVAMEMEQMMSSEDEEDPPSYWPFARKNWWPISKGVSHCGAGCTLGDIVGEWIIYLTAWSIPLFATQPPNTLFAAYIADFVLAWTLGIIFQYFSIVPMREDIGRLQGIWAAIKADTLSIIAFQLGLFGYMALYHLVFFKPPLSIASPTYWFMMQIGMIAGFFTAWPVNTRLIRQGWKEKM